MAEAGRAEFNSHALLETAGAYVQVAGSSSNYWAMGSTGGENAPGTASTTLAFHNYNGSAWSNPFSISNSGNVGIGTSLNSDLHGSATNILLGRAGSLYAERDSGLGIPVTAIGYNFYLDSDTGNYAARIASAGTNIACGAGTISFNTAASVSAGAAITYVSRMNIALSGDVVINDSGAASDFRVESDSKTHMLFVDAGSNFVGINKNNAVSTCDLSMNAGSTPGIQTQNLTTGTTNLVLDVRSNGTSTIGTINATNTATQFNTSSDYRLKENVETLKDGLDRLTQLKPVQFTWKVDNSLSEGFIAHEVEDVFPDAVSGEKDAVDEKGDIDPQQVDYGRITPLLVKAIQEQQEQIEELKAEIATLKGE